MRDGRQVRYNPPPNWPPPPPGWTPSPGWLPDPAWPPLPPGWQLWVPDSAPRNRKGLIIGAGVAVLALAAIVAGVLVVVLGVFLDREAKPSDEQQIRQVFARGQDAWNDSDFEEFRDITCAAAVLGEESESHFRETRDQLGRVEIIVESVQVSGDKATAAVSQHFENDFDLDSDQYPVVREGGRWKMCSD